MAARARPLSGAIDRSREHLKLLLDRAGPVLSGTETARLLGVDKARVDRLRAERRLLAIPLGEGWAYPAFQFQGGAVLPGLEGLLQAHEGKESWAVLDLLLAPDPALDGRAPVQALRDGDATGLRRHVSQSNGDGFA